MSGVNYSFTGFVEGFSSQENRLFFPQNYQVSSGLGFPSLDLESHTYEYTKYL